MNELQKKMVAAAEEMAARGQVKDDEAREKGFRKRVFEAIMALSDEGVSEQAMLKHLPYLDRASWAEVAEERFIAHLCALPSCEKTLKRPKLGAGAAQPLYKIDRAEGKIYASGHAEREGFCGAACHARADRVRALLPDEPLWARGGRPAEADFAATKDVAPSPLGRSPGRCLDRVEIVRDSLLVSRLDSLFIAERDGASSDEEKEGEGEPEADAAEGEEKSKEEDAEFVSSIQRYCTMGGAAGGGGGGSIKKEEPSAKMEVDQKARAKSEAQRLAEVQAKLKNRKANVVPKRQALLTDPKSLTSLQLREEQRILAAMVKKEKEAPAADGEEISNGITREELDALPEITIPFTGDWETISNLFVEWIGRRTTEVVRMGGRRPVNEVDRMLQRFYAGDKAEAMDVDEAAPLPMVDGCDVKKRRIDIMISSIRPTWLSLEGHLAVRSTRLDDVRSVVSSLALSAASINGWSKREIRIIALGLWRCVCLLSDELDADFFPNGAIAAELRSVLERWQLDESAFVRLVALIEGRIAMHDKPETDR